MSDFETVMQPFHITFAEPPPEGRGPIPVVIRVARDGDTPNAFASRRAGHVRLTAADAHDADRGLAPTDEERVADRKYADASRLLRLAASAEPIEGWSDPIFSEDGEFYLDVDNLLDIEETDARPAFVYEGEPGEFTFDAIEQLGQWLDENSFEDAETHLVDLDELAAFWTAWKAKQTITWWTQSRRIRIVDPAAFARRLLEAEEIVARGRPNLALPEA